MSILVVSEASKIMIRNERLVIKKEEDIYINIFDVDAIVIESMQILITPSAIINISENKIPLIICNKKHMPQVFCFDLYNYFEVSKKIHEQVNWDESKKIKLWREIIRTKIENQNNLILNFYNEMEVCEKIQIHLIYLMILLNYLDRWLIMLFTINIKR